MPAINELSVSIYFSMPRMKINVVRGDFGQPVNTDGFWWDIQNYDGANKMQIEQRRVIFLKLFYIQNKEIGNKKYYEENKENLKNGKVRFRLNIDVRKEKTCG